MNSSLSLCNRTFLCVLSPEWPVVRVIELAKLARSSWAIMRAVHDGNRYSANTFWHRLSRKYTLRRYTLLYKPLFGYVLCAMVTFL